MPGLRRDDQTVDAFSLSRELLDKAKAKASEMGMSKSGFFRYCLAKSLGYSESQARDMALHNSVRILREKVEGSSKKQDVQILQRTGPVSSKVAAIAVAAIPSALAAAGIVSPGSSPSPVADAPTSNKPAPTRGTGSRSARPPGTPKPAPKQS